MKRLYCIVLLFLALWSCSHGLPVASSLAFNPKMKSRMQLSGSMQVEEESFHRQILFSITRNEACKEGDFNLFQLESRL